MTDGENEDRFHTLRVERLVEHHALLLAALQDVADGVTPNLMVFMPPGSAKSTYVDVVFVPWFMARTAKQNVILASYGSDLARKQGRRARQLVRSRSFETLFPAKMSLDSSAADEWSLTNGSEYMAGGLLSGITGNRADLGIVDDPVKGREDAESDTVRKKTREAYEDDFCTRLKPNGRQVIIQCMVGSTRVLMADGTEKQLKNISPGDWVASHENGRLSAAKVVNWANQGPDCCITMTTRSGITVTANERHPFLVDRSGTQVWVRLRNIAVGDRMVRVIGESGAECSAQKPVVESQSSVGASVVRTTPNGGALATYATGLDPIVEIAPAGREDVFDIQVERTANFIANGLVSHNTRWHADDLSGAILPADWAGESGRIQCRDGREWMVLCLPAMANRIDDPLGRKPGEYLWPEWFPPAHWEPFKRNNRTWSALYQQCPTPDEGTYFRKEWFLRHAEKPPHLRIYASSDYAVTEDGGDWTVHRVWGVDQDFNIYLLDGWRGQTTADVWMERQIDLVEKWKPLAWFGEAGVIAKTIEPMLIRRLRDRRQRCRLEWLPSIADKPTRARGFQARAAMKQVSLPIGVEGDAVLDEYLRFPAGKHDDDVDCASLIGRALDEMHPAVVPAKEVSKNPLDLWSRPRTSADDWKTA